MQLPLSWRFCRSFAGKTVRHCSTQVTSNFSACSLQHMQPGASTCRNYATTSTNQKKCSAQSNSHRQWNRSFLISWTCRRPSKRNSKSSSIPRKSSILFRRIFWRLWVYFLMGWLIIWRRNNFSIRGLISIWRYLLIRWSNCRIAMIRSSTNRVIYRPAPAE